VVLFKVLSRQLTGGTEENYDLINNSDYDRDVRSTEVKRKEGA
jgi:hypothetical protein